MARFLMEDNIMKRFFLFLILLFPLLLEAQTLDIRFDGAITNHDLNKKEDAVQVSLVQGGQNLVSVLTNAKGNYTLKTKINPQKSFDIVFSKNGLVSKKVSFDFNGLDVTSLPAGAFSPVDALNLDLFAERPGIDFSFLNNEPVGKFVWDKKTMSPKLDENARKLTADKIAKKLEEAKKTAGEQQKNELTYTNAIKNADKAYGEKKYQLALDQYEAALLVPGKGKEKYPNDKIIEITSIIQKEKEKQLKANQENSEYTNLISAADNLRTSDELEKAKQKYSEASQLKPNEQYPKERIKEIESQLKAKQNAQANKAKYEQFVQQGDQFLKTQQYNEAKKAFEQAASIEKTDYVQSKLLEINQKIASQKSQQAQETRLAQLINEGDKAQSEKKFTLALAKYKEATQIEPNNKDIAQKIAQTQELIKQESEAKNIDNQFTTLVRLGDKALNAKKYQEAIKQYDEALALKNDPQVSNKRTQAQSTLDGLQQKQNSEMEFKSLVDQAKKAELSKDYPQAVNIYQEALKIKGNDPIVARKISDIQKIINQQEQQALQQQNKQEQEQKIKTLIQEGNSLMEASDLSQKEKAKEKFVEVLKLDGKNPIAKQRIADIDKQIALQKEKEEKEKTFSLLVSKADQEQQSTRYLEAVQLYDKALTIQQDASVQEKKTIAQRKLNEQMVQDRATKEYQNTLLVADKFRDAQKYADAIAKYEYAKKLDPSKQSYPQQEIEKINDLIAQQRKNEAVNKQITQQLYRAKVAFDQKKWNDASSLYQEVLSIDPNNTIAKAQLSLVEEEKSKIEKKNKDMELFEILRAQGIAYGNNKEWASAKNAFEQALTLKKDGEVIKRLGEVYQAIEEEQKAQQIEQEYQGLLQEARQAESIQYYPQAIDLYQQAVTLKPSKQLMNKLYEVKAKNEEQKIQWELDDRYGKFMSKGDWMLDNEEYRSAILNYRDALDVKPNDAQAREKLELAKQKLSEQRKKEEDMAIQKLIAEINPQIDRNEFAAARQNIQKALKIRTKDPEIIGLISKIERIEKENQTFASLMNKAKALESIKNYKDALNLYEQASQIKPSESGLPAKIQEVQKLYEEQKIRHEQDTQYNSYYAAALQNQARGEYEQALVNYEQARSIKPNEEQVQLKIAEVSRLLAKVEAERKQREEEDIAFNKLVFEANEYYNAKDYQKSMEVLREALSQRPDNVYIRTKLAEVDRLYRVEAKEQLEQQYQKLRSTADIFLREKDFEQALSYYNKALEIKEEDPYLHAKIKEINGILNPTMETSYELHDLGEPFDGSILDGALALVKAEEQRKDIKINQLHQVNQQAIATNIEIQENKQKELDVTIQNLYDFYVTMLQTENFKASERIHVFADYREKTIQQLELNIATSNEQTQSTFETQEQLNAQNQQASTIFDGKEIAPQEMRSSINEIRTQEEEEERLRSVAKQFENRVRDGGLTLLKNQQEELETVSTGEQIYVADQVEKQRIHADNYVDNQGNISYQKNISLKEQTDEIQNAIQDNNTAVVDNAQQSQTLDELKIKEENRIEDKIRWKTDEREQIDSDLSNIQKAKDEQDYSDAENKSRGEQIKVAKSVENTRSQMEDQHATRLDQNYQDALRANEQAEHINFTLMEIGNANVELLAENNQKFRIQERALLEKQQYDMEKDYKESVDAEIKMREIRQLVVENQATAEANLIPTIQIVHTAKQELIESEQQIIQKHANKAGDTKNVLDQQDIRKEEQQIQATVALNEKVKDVNHAVASAINVHEQIGNTTYEEQLKIQTQMNLEKDGNDTKFAQKENETKQKSEGMNEVSKALSIESTAKETEKTNTIHATKTQIEKSTNYTAQTAYIPNSLGEKYPEGVSQEMYQRKDDSGILVAIITRRVVVVQGRGTEYICTQTNHGTTYTKEGNPITEYTWQKETQDASLVRHY